MSENELEEMEMSTFFLKLFYKNQGDEADRRYYGELLRLQTLQLLNIQLDRSHKIHRVEDVWSLPWDNESNSAVELTEEQRRERVKYLCELARRELNG